MTQRSRRSFGLFCLFSFLLTPAPFVQAQEAVDPAAPVDFDLLTPETAEAWAELVLKNIDIEFPNKMSFVYVDASQVNSDSR